MDGLVQLAVNLAALGRALCGRVTGLLGLLLAAIAEPEPQAEPLTAHAELAQVTEPTELVPA